MTEGDASREAFASGRARTNAAVPATPTAANANGQAPHSFSRTTCPGSSARPMPHRAVHTIGATR